MQKEKSVEDSDQGVSYLFNRIMLDDLCIPGRPDIAVKLIALFDDDNCSMHKIEEVVFEDQSLTSTVLRVANAPFYRTGKTINTLAEAIVTLGLQNLLSIVSMVCLTNQIAGASIDLESIRHSLAVSQAAGALTGGKGFIRRQEAMIAGVLHDIGKTIIEANAPEQYTLIRKSVEQDEMPFNVAEDEILGFNHTHVGNILTKKWKLPELYGYVIKNHHHNPIDERMEYRHASLLCSVVRVADKLVHDNRIGYGGSHEENLGALMTFLDIDKQTLDTVRCEIASSFSSSAQPNNYN